MSFLATLLAFGWIGGNLVKEGQDMRAMEGALNKPGERIQFRNGKYYDTWTRRQVTLCYKKSEYLGECVATYYDSKTCREVYCPREEEWFKENMVWKKKIDAAVAEHNEEWMQEAIDNGMRFAKQIIPYELGAREIKVAYVDRMRLGDGVKYYVKDDSYVGRRKYYFTRELKFSVISGRWTPTTSCISNTDVEKTKYDEEQLKRMKEFWGIV